MRLQELLKYDSIVIQCHDNPDADALSSGFALTMYLKKHEKDVRLVYGGKNLIRKSNLKMMVETLSIPVEHVETLPTPELLVTVDCQYGAGNVTQFKAENVAIIDHHRVSVELPELSEVNSSLGSCATLIWSLLKQERFEVNCYPELATALYYGLYSDTNGFSEISHPLDKDLRDAMKFSGELLNRYRNANISLEELEIAGAALMQYEYNEEYQFAVVKAAPCDPNVLGIISDLLLEVDSVNVGLVFSVFPDGVKISVRSCIKEVKANELADEICEEIGDGGGHFSKAGGFIQMDLLNEAYRLFCRERKFTPRFELSPDGKEKHMTISAIKSFLVNRMEEYFRTSEIIYAKNYVVKNETMTEYLGNPVLLGYVRACELFPVGTPVTVRTIEEDLDTVIEDDTILTIGVNGEVYLAKGSSFAKKHHVYELPFELSKEARYVPTIRNAQNGKIISLLDVAKICIPCGYNVVRAKQLDHNVKLFTVWDEGKYVKGNPGDYLILFGEDSHGINIIKQNVFEMTYRKKSDFLLQQEIEAVIFDLDGTLLNTLEDLADAVNAALEKNQLPKRTIEEVRQFVGNGVKTLMIRAVPEGEKNPRFAQAFADFKQYYAAHCKDKTDVYPGIRPLMEELRLRRIAMGIVSNKMDLAVKTLNQEYFSNYIETAIGETEKIAKKPAPDTLLAAVEELGVDKNRVLYVGDSEVDIQTAKNAGIDCISVTWGFRDREFLIENGAKILIDRPLELLLYVQDVHS